MHAEIAICINPGRDDAGHRPRPGATKRACAGAEGGARGEHVVHQRDGWPIVARGDGERPTHLNRPCSGRRAPLLDVLTRAFHHSEHGNVPEAAQVAGHLRRGVEATFTHPLRAAWHRDEHSRWWAHAGDDEFGEDDGDPTPTSVFERMDERAGRPGEEHAVANLVELSGAFRACENGEFPRMAASGTCGPQRAKQLAIALVAQVRSRQTARGASGWEDEFQQAVEHTADRARGDVTCLCRN